MNPDMRHGLQQALAQLTMWLSLDYDGALAIHDQAVKDGTTWELNQALLYLLDRSVRRPNVTTEDLITGLRNDIAGLAAQEDDPDQDDPDEEDK